MTKHKIENINQILKEYYQLEQYPNLYFREQSHLANTLQFALQNKTQIEENHSVENCLSSLNNMAKNNDEIALLYPDFVKHSFYWQLYKKTGEYDMNGGIILHGYQETYAVEISPKNKPHWSIHT